MLNKDARLQYAAEVGKDNRISVLLDTATPMAGGPPSFEQLQALLKGGQPATEALNGRLAMLAVLGAAGVELATGRTLLEQAATPAGAAAAGGLALFVTAASLAPVLLGRVLPAAAVPTENDSYPDSQLPYFWTGLAETINGR